MAAFYYLFNKVIGLYIWVVIAAVIVNLLIAFNVISAYNPYVKALAAGSIRSPNRHCSPYASSCQIWAGSIFRQWS